MAEFLNFIYKKKKLKRAKHKLHFNRLSYKNHHFQILKTFSQHKSYTQLTYKLIEV